MPYKKERGRLFPRMDSEKLQKIAEAETDKKTCPVCYSKNTLFKKKTQTTWCRKCGAEWVTSIRKVEEL